MVGFVCLLRNSTRLLELVWLLSVLTARHGGLLVVAVAGIIISLIWVGADSCCHELNRFCGFWCICSGYIVLDNSMFFCLPDCGFSRTCLMQRALAKKLRYMGRCTLPPSTLDLVLLDSDSSARQQCEQSLSPSMLSQGGCGGRRQMGEGLQEPPPHPDQHPPTPGGIKSHHKMGPPRTHIRNARARNLVVVTADSG